MAKFLTGPKLSAKIREVLTGENLKCAVAFWGKDTDIIKHFEGAEIICDIHSGGTNPVVLEKLIEQNDVRYYQSLHAKVYWSSKGVVIGSANASSSGLGTLEENPNNLEAGVFHKPDLPIWKSVEKWFDGAFKNSHCVGESALQRCKERWSSKEKQSFPEEANKKMQEAQKRGSLLEMVCANPEVFSKISFVFTDTILSEKEASNVKERTIESLSDQLEESKKEKICQWRKEHIFSDWEKYDILKMGSLFINVHFRLGKPYIFGYKTFLPNSEQGDLFGELNWSELKQFILKQNKECKFPNKKRIDWADGSTLLKLKKKMMNRVVTSFELRDEIEELKYL